MKIARTLVFVLGLALAAGGTLPAMAQEANADKDAIMTSDGFLSFHPDLRHRLSALGDYRKQNYADAFQSFKRAARFADKPSQGMLGEMLWNGLGVEADRASAYVWMDLAAERGYKMMLVKRENYWAEMTEEERARALEIGDALYLEYGDKYAKPRLEQRLRQARMRTTGGRTGFVGSLVIEVPTPGGSRSIDGSTYYKDEYWKPDQYWRMQDSDWKDYGEGIVEIGEIQSVGELTVPGDTDENESDEAPR
jgi:hypothetical protein